MEWKCVIDDNLAVLLTLALIFWLSCRYFANRYLPPGPCGLPVVGYTPFIDETESHKTFYKLSQKYGNIFSLYMGKTLFVVLSDYEAVKECFVKQGEYFSGRPVEFNVVGWFFDYKDIVSSEGVAWKEHRRFALRNLRDFGFGKLSLEDRFQDETEKFFSEIRKQNSENHDVLQLLSLQSCNVISTLVFGRDYDYDDPQLVRILHLVDDATNKMSQTAILESFPILRFLPKKWTSLDSMAKARDALRLFVREIIDQHESNLQLHSARDLIDVYLLKCLEYINTPEPLFSRDHVLQNVITIFTTGIETTSAGMAWALKLMAKHPHVQRKVQEEIDLIVGDQRFPSWADRSRLPYTEATIYEIFRYSSVTPFGLPHSNCKSARILGYKIPARSKILVNYWQLHHDENVWSLPDEFDPTRFLDENGKLNKLTELLALFGLGKRVCMGESLAKMEVFYFFCAILQNFEVKPPEGRELNMDCSNGALRLPKTCCLRFIPRSK